MEMMRLDGTKLLISRSGFGALPIQRVDLGTANVILRKAYEGGINFFDTARAYSDSEEKIGYALADVRNDIVIATKTNGSDRAAVLQQLEVSLRKLKTDYVDILQLHMPKCLLDPQDSNSAYAGLRAAQAKGMARYIGLTNHRLAVALEAAKSRKYATVQFPLSHISAPQDLVLIDVCRKNGVGVIAMKALCGGLITQARSAFAFLRQYGNVVPIWGIQGVSEP